jgi:hypothetical protein
MRDNNIKKLRGKPALEAAHVDLTDKDEARLDTLISDLYGVESDEAADIHASYHLERIFIAVEKRARKNGMTKDTLLHRMQYFDTSGTARQVARGRMTEAAAVDVLFRSVSRIESPYGYDRYINFYG